MKQLEAYPSNTNLDTIHDLEHIADINPQYHWVIMNMCINDKLITEVGDLGKVRQTA